MYTSCTEIFLLPVKKLKKYVLGFYYYSFKQVGFQVLIYKSYKHTYHATALKAYLFDEEKICS